MSASDTGGAVASSKNVPLTRRQTEELARTAELLVRENKHLRVENKNMYHLLEENKGLNSTVQELRWATHYSYHYYYYDEYYNYYYGCLSDNKTLRASEGLCLSV